MEWLLYTGLLMQFVGVFLTIVIDSVNFEWVLKRMRENSREMITPKEEQKFSRRRNGTLLGFGLIIGGIGCEILNVVNSGIMPFPTSPHTQLVVIHSYSITFQEHVDLTDTIFTKH